MKFHYTARTKKGELQVGNVNSNTRDSAISILNSHDLYILSIEEVKENFITKNLNSFFNRVKRVDLMIMTRQFATMLDASIPLNEALKSLIKSTKSVSLRAGLTEISEDIDSGLSLSDALARQEHIFSDFYINLIKSAEVTGQIESSLNFLAEYLEREATLITKVRNAMIYPVFVIVLFFITTGVLLGVVFPQLQPIFEESKVQLPFISRFFLSLGLFISNWWFIIIISLVVLSLFLLEYLRSKEGRMVLDEVILRAPLFGRLLKEAYVARFAESTSVLLKGGIPISEALEISSNTIGSYIYKESLLSSASKVREGELLSNSLTYFPDLFPTIVIQMITVGEETGRLDGMLNKIYDFYSKDINGLVDSLVELIQPILILIIGGMIGLLFASILLPIYSLTQSF